MNVWDKLQIQYVFQAGTGRTFHKQWQNQTIGSSHFRHQKQVLKQNKEIYKKHPKKPFDSKPFVTPPKDGV
ncbi:MAG TPA: hypothetical protein VNX68_00975 [Nitrosopumilaceae archaeon]|jgi:hypothetical protein|nr:hypothetical protein [Nitrosopumilaceae archaeon]